MCGPVVLLFRLIEPADVHIAWHRASLRRPRSCCVATPKNRLPASADAPNVSPNSAVPVANRRFNATSSGNRHGDSGHRRTGQYRVASSTRAPHRESEYETDRQAAPLRWKDPRSCPCSTAELPSGPGDGGSWSGSTLGRERRTELQRGARRLIHLRVRSHAARADRAARVWPVDLELPASDRVRVEPVAHRRS